MAEYKDEYYEEVISDRRLPRFHRAAVDGNTEMMVSCLPRNINEPYTGKYELYGDSFSFSCTALHLAAYRGKAGTVQTLLERGARVDVKDRWGQTPLHRARDTAVVQLLLDRSADISARDQWQRTPLHLARDTAVVQLLLDRSADISARDQWQQTPLHRASQSWDPAVVQLLLDRGADISARDDCQQTPLYRARDPAVAQLLLDRGADISARDSDQRTPLHVAIESRDPAVVQLLLDSGADISARDNKQRTPIHVASGYSRDPAVVQLLLDCGADISARDEDQKTPLHWASESGDPAIVQLLLDRGADISARDSDHKTPMQWAVLYHSFESASLMLTKTASPQQTWVHKLVTTAEVTQDRWIKRSILTPCADMMSDEDITIEDDTVLDWSGLDLTDTSLREKFQQLPKGVRYHALFIHSNQISTLMNLLSYKQLHSLSYLVLSDNPIHTIEGLPPQLKRLYCNGTEIQVLGKACFHEGYIKVLKQALEDAELYNSLKQPPPEVIERGIKDILRYFTKELMSNSQYRVVGIGDTGAGKSSCLESVVLGKPYLTREADRTHVLDLKHWRVNDEDFFTFFDQGGHEVYDITNPYFVSIKSLVLIFQDLCKTENIPRTLDILRRSLHQHPQNAIHFVLTHIDQVDQVKQSVQSFKKKIQELLQGEISTFERLLASPKNKGYIQEKDIQSLLEHCQGKLSTIRYFPISSKTYEGIEELKTFLISTMEKQRVNIPTLWIDCLQKMEASKLSFWTKSKLMEVMNVSQSDSPVSQSGSSLLRKPKQILKNIKVKSKKLLKFRSVSGRKEDSSVHNSEVLDCLRYLNDTGMVIWMEDHETLKEYIFHKIEFLIEVLKSLFHHDLKSTIQYDTDPNLPTLFTETQFEDTLKKYQEEGILKFSFLKYLWRKYELHENDELALIALIRKFHLFSQIPSDQDKVFFVPWFVKKNKVPPNFNVSDPLVINSKEVSLNMECLFHNRLPLNVTEQFLVEVQGYVYNKGVKGSRYAWADGLQVHIDKTTITAFRNVEQATLSLVITAECDYLAEMWDSLQQLSKCLNTILQFYHGSLRSHHSNCLHCKKVGICPVHRWLLEDVLPERPFRDLYMRCDKDKTADVPAALMTRMPNDDKTQQRLGDVKTYLRTDPASLHPATPSTQTEVHLEEGGPSTPLQVRPKQRKSTTKGPQYSVHRYQENLDRRPSPPLNTQKRAFNPQMMSTSVENLDDIDDNITLHRAPSSQPQVSDVGFSTPLEYQHYKGEPSQFNPLVQEPPSSQFNPLVQEPPVKLELVPVELEASDMQVMMPEAVMRGVQLIGQELSLHRSILEQLTGKTDELSTTVIERADEISTTVKQKTDEISTTVKENTEQLSSKVAEQGKEISNKVTVQGKDISSKVTEQGKEISSKVTEQGKDISSKVTEQAKDISNKVTEQGKEISSKVTEQAKDISNKVTEQGKEISNKVTEQGKELSSKVTEQSKEISSKVAEQSKEISSKVTEQAKEISSTVTDNAEKLITRIKLDAGSAVSLDLNCSHPVLREHQSLLEENLDADDPVLLDGLYSKHVISATERSEIENDKQRLGKTKRLLLCIDKHESKSPGTVVKFIEVLEKCKEGTINYYLAPVLRERLEEEDTNLVTETTKM